MDKLVKFDYEEFLKDPLRVRLESYPSVKPIKGSGLYGDLVIIYWDNDNKFPWVCYARDFGLLRMTKKIRIVERRMAKRITGEVYWLCSDLRDLHQEHPFNGIHDNFADVWAGPIEQVEVEV